jgi:hypothetical protein
MLPLTAPSRIRAAADPAYPELPNPRRQHSAVESVSGLAFTHSEWVVPQHEARRERGSASSPSVFSPRPYTHTAAAIGSSAVFTFSRDRGASGYEVKCTGSGVAAANVEACPGDSGLVRDGALHGEGRSYGWTPCACVPDAR